MYICTYMFARKKGTPWLVGFTDVFFPFLALAFFGFSAVLGLVLCCVCLLFLGSKIVSKGYIKLQKKKKKEKNNEAIYSRNMNIFWPHPTKESMFFREYLIFPEETHLA